MAWYLAPSLAKLRAEVDARWPRRDKASDGTIGDEAHQNTNSDHNPNSRDSVNAWDMDKDGVNVPEVIAAFQRHPSANYWIWQGQIADRDDGWRKRAYGGTNPHTQHAHFSIRQSVTAEQDRRSWGLLEDDMAEIDEILSRVRYMDSRLDAMTKGLPTIASGFPAPGTPMWTVATLKAITAKLDALSAAVGNVDEATAETLKARFDLIEMKLNGMDTLLQEHANGEIDAEEVVRRMGELLSS